MCGSALGNVAHKPLNEEWGGCRRRPHRQAGKYPTIILSSASQRTAYEQASRD